MVCPRAAARSMDSGDVAATQTGGGFCSGLGRTSMLSKSQNLPWNVSRSSRQAC
jgi:hypothetical protein